MVGDASGSCEPRLVTMWISNLWISCYILSILFDHRLQSVFPSKCFVRGTNRHAYTTKKCGCWSWPGPLKAIRVQWIIIVKHQSGIQKAGRAFTNAPQSIIYRFQLHGIRVTKNSSIAFRVLADLDNWSVIAWSSMQQWFRPQTRPKMSSLGRKSNGRYLFYLFLIPRWMLTACHWQFVDDVMAIIILCKYGSSSSCHLSTFCSTSSRNAIPPMHILLDIALQMPSLAWLRFITFWNNVLCQIGVSSDFHFYFDYLWHRRPLQLWARLSHVSDRIVEAGCTCTCCNHDLAGTYWFNCSQTGLAVLTNWPRGHNAEEDGLSRNRWYNCANLQHG